jgi:type I restriction enzyme S subunit
MSSESPACVDLRHGAPKDWAVLPLDAVTDFQEGPGILAKDFHESGVPLLRLRNIETATVQLAGCNFLDGEKVQKKWSHFGLVEGDLLISTSASLGRVSVVSAEAAGSVAYTGIIRFRSSSPKLSHKYLRAFLSSAAFVKQAEQMATGSVIKHFGPSHLKKMAIILPSLLEQVQIAEIFDVLDDRIALLRETNATLEAIAQALFKSWFVDFDPVRAKVEGREPEGLDAETAALFPNSFEESEMGLIPKGWKVLQFSEFIVRHPLGKKYDQKTALSEGKVPILDQGKSGVIGFHNDEAGVKASLNKPVVVFANHTCYMRLITFNFSAIQNVLPFTGNGVDTIWAFYATKDRVKFSEYKGHWPDFAIEKGVVPDENTALSFRRTVDPLVRSMRNNELMAQTLASLRDTLLPRLISGQLRLPEAKILLETAA